MTAASRTPKRSPRRHTRLRGRVSVPVYSLYRSDGDTGVPPGALAGLDALVVDLQDVGARYYTYLSTLGILLEAAADAGAAADRA